MRHLYTYLPKDNTADTEGLLSTRLAPAGWEKYKERSGKHTKAEVLAWLDLLDPGFKRSNAISVLTEPIPDNAHPKIRAYADAHTLYAMPEYKELVKLELVKAIVRANRGRRGTTRISAPRYNKIDWENIEPGKFLMSNVPHYLIETIKGKIPPEYVEKQASEIEDMARPHYPTSGSHGWNHIEDVLANAKAMVEASGEKWTPAMEAAVMYHDSGLYPNGIDSEEVRDGHESRGAEIVRNELAGKFTPRQLRNIAAAIAEHRGSYKGLYTSKLSDLVSSADRGAPDLGAKIRRSYQYHIENHTPRRRIPDEVVAIIREKYGKGGYARFPEYYRKLYAKELAQFQQAASDLTPAEVRRILTIQRARDFLQRFADEAAKEKLPLFAVTEGASITRNNGSAAVRAARKAHAAWEREHGGDPNEDWGLKQTVSK